MSILLSTPTRTALQAPTHQGARSALQRVAFCFAAVATCASALAQNTTMPQTPSYIELSAGSIDYTRLNAGTGGLNRDATSNTYSLSVGNYMFSPYWGLEAGYSALGNISRGGGKTSAEGLHLQLIGRAPLSTDWNLLGKAGTTYAHTDANSTAGSGVAEGSEHAFGWSYGLGLEYKLAPQWSAVLLYEEHSLKFPGGGTTDPLAATSLAVRYLY
jgi:opacity protein-like surface antigen